MKEMFPELNYDYARIIDLIWRIEDCAKTVANALPDRTLDGNIKARNYTAQIETDARELSGLLLTRHLDLQRSK